jgi:PAS domain-containing protein
LQEIRRQVPALAGRETLAATLAAARQGSGLPAGHKLLIVLDQFEQWLHGARDATDTALVDALRQCDGVCVQCLLLVRDDFWLPLGRFLREVEVPLREGENCAAVDRFDPLHARAVLLAFGRAYQRLPTGALTADQDRFLDQALEGLSEDGAIAPVRLSLFADMVKGKAWEPETLRQVGGARGVGVAFLENRLGKQTAPAPYRPYAAAAAVLAALLPDADGDIRGAARSMAELQERAGLRDAAELETLLRILDGELRLLTPAAEAPGSTGERRYQLTHDYLVSAIRDWLRRTQRQSRQGRADLCFRERFAAWEARPEPRNLPGLREWLAIRMFLNSASWTAAQQAMMRQAARLHAARFLLLSITILLLGFAGREAWSRYQERARRNFLLHPELTPEARDYLRDLDFTEVITNVPGIFYLKDRNGVYIYANDTMNQDFERDEVRLIRGIDVVGKTDHDLPWKDDADMIRAQDAKVLARGKAITFHEMHRLRDGTQVPYVTVKAPLRNRKGDIIGIIGYTLEQPRHLEHP